MSRFSNTPQFLRRTFFDSCIQPWVAAQERFDTHNSGAGGVEENINRRLVAIENMIGIPAIARALGMAIYGPIGGPATVRHIGV